MSGARYRAVLTGASGGIGTALAHALAPLSDALLLAGREAPRLESLKQTLIGRFPHLQVQVVAGDLSQVGARERLAVGAAALPGGLNLLVNNAGVSEFAWLTDQAEAAIESQLQTNLLLPILLSRQLLPQLLAQPAAIIANVGSVFGELGYPGVSVYCATKFGLRGFSESLRRELADTAVSVRYLAPRATRTAFNADAQTAMNAELGVAMDPPERVAEEFLKLLQGRANERLIGMPEGVFARINRLLPAVVDGSLRKQLQTVKRYAQKNIQGKDKA